MYVVRHNFDTVITFLIWKILKLTLDSVVLCFTLMMIDVIRLLSNVKERNITIYIKASLTDLVQIVSSF